MIDIVITDTEVYHRGSLLDHLPAKLAQSVVDEMLG